jgi:hypothetical protein
MEELKRDSERNDAVTKEEGRAGITTDLPARVSPFVPNTAARRNVTMRKSRDRLHDALPPRTPDDVLKRRSSRRVRDVQYENEINFQGASAVTHSKRHGEELYQNIEGRSLVLPDGKERGLFKHIADHRALEKEQTQQLFADHLGDDEARVFESFLFNSITRNDTSTGIRTSPAKSDYQMTFNEGLEKPDDDQNPGGSSRNRPGNNGEEHSHDGESSDEDTSKDSGERLSQGDGDATPLFLRRDIPSLDDDGATHDTLMQLWDERQQASLLLVQALDQDEPALFEEIENRMRQINKTMHDVHDQYKKNNKNSYLSVDDLPLVAPTSLLKQAYKSSSEGEFRLVLDYQDNQIIRTANPMTSTKVVYHWAQQYLREAFSLDVPDIAHILLLHEHKVLPTLGCLEDVPVFGGAEIEIIFLGKQRVVSASTVDPFQRQAPTVDHAGQRGEESHGLYHARAPSQPGNNGGAASSFDHAGQSREESHGLYHARAPSQPGNNGGAASSFGHAGQNREENHGHGRTGNQNKGEWITHLLDKTTGHHASTAGQHREEGHGFNPEKGYNNQEAVPQRDEASRGSGSYDKIRQAFKCPKFSGQAREWKQWHKGFMRYLSIWDLEYVLLPEFLDDVPMSPTKVRDNKMVYYIIEDAVQNSAMASSIVREAPVNNGFLAYYTLHDGYVFAGATTSTLLLNELSNFRFLPNETPTALCLRLGELFQELELLPGDAAVSFIDTQKIGYLLNALRHEEEWSNVTSHITSAQIKGTITFREACEELKVRCEVARVHEMMDHPVKGGKKVKGLGGKVKDGSSGKDDLEEMTEQLSEKVLGMISSMVKRQNAAADDGPPGGTTPKKKKHVKQECLAAGCDEQTTFSLCGLHYHSMISGKTPTLTLRNGYGEATYDTSTSLIVYPPRTPVARLPTNTPRKVKANLANTGE